jgi:hypothetical protein
VGTVCGQCVGGFQLGEQVSVAGGWLFEVDVPCSALRDIVGIGCHKNRVVSTKSFENTLFSAGRKKKQGKLLQKERGLDGASPLDRA